MQSIKLASEKSAGEANDLVLPIQLENGTTYVYQAENVVTVERRQNQFRLECNLKFDLCTLELSGWYHGKTAGILGTMNYEPTDDMTASDGIMTKNVTAFGESWSIDREDCPAGRTKTGSTAKSEDIDLRYLVREQKFGVRQLLRRDQAQGVLKHVRDEQTYIGSLYRGIILHADLHVPRHVSQNTGRMQQLQHGGR